MKSSDWSLLALNAFIGFVTLVGALNAKGGEELGFFTLATLAVVVNSLVVVGKTRAKQPPARVVDELDAAAVLDLDARLEAVEKAQADAADAARWRALVESGQVTGPAADAPTDAVRQSTRNGQSA